jgi:hypothetical protein
MQTPLKTKIGLFIAIPIYVTIAFTGLLIAISVIITLKILNFFGVIDAIIFLLKKTEAMAKKYQIRKMFDPDKPM